MATDTEISIDNIEDSIKARLDLKLAALITAKTVEVELFPESISRFKRPINSTGRISVCYMDATYEKLLSTDVVAQQGLNNFAFFCASKNRRGDGGVNHLIRLVLKYLIGFAPLGHQKMTAKEVKLIMRENDTNLWEARVELQAKYLLVEFNDDPAPGKISEMTFSPPDGGAGDDVVVNSSTVATTKPII